MSHHDCRVPLWFEGNASSREQRWHRNFNLHPSYTNALRNPHAVYTNWSLCFKREHLSGSVVQHAEARGPLLHRL